ncbi:hypothetical protein SISSUDRAFT_1128375 [Sistotremastrum suecicum HHB10207 ss-3]|uniref:F-box domain-containing protein n=1 Tax=Sistotremastrum suecicum HHB10207 ss-3 TaxID=1314776 RepID=A0A166DXS1_9AGAM|nr:hypothetical protein SISSUDRAFT_1128375 [Sistotremastrum suecicum HHB10207 ss-3]
MDVPDNPDTTSHFPNEIIAEILENVVHTEFASMQDLIEPGHYASKWTLILSICRRWSEIALASPDIWSSIHLCWPRDIVITFLRRSQSAPLSVALNQDFVQDFLAAAFDDVPLDAGHTVLALGRMRKLNVEWNVRMGYGEFLLNITQAPAIDWQGSLALLSHFRSRNILFTPDTLMFVPESLRYANIGPADVGIHIIDFLSTTPVLHTLELEERIDDDSIPLPAGFTFPPNVPPTPLHSLKRLRIGWMQTEYLNQILPRISCPAVSHISLSIKRDEYSTVLESLPLSCIDDFRSSTALSIFGDPWNRFSTNPESPFIIHWTTPSATPGADPDAIEHRVEFNEWDAGEHRWDEMDHIFYDLTSDAYSCVHLTRLNLSITRLPYPTLLFKFLTPLVKLEELIVRVVHVAPLLVVLDPRNSDRPNLICPALIKIDLRKSAFEPSDLAEVLEEREARECGVKELKITIGEQLQEANVPVHDLQGLREIFDKIRGSVEVYEAEEGGWIANEHMEEVL